MENQRLLLILGGVAAVLAAVVVALLLMGGPQDRPDEPDDAERAGLQVDVTDAESLSPDQELRCFVGGRFVGMATLSDCAERNGVASQALDVGLDSSGELTAVPFTPPPDLPPLTDEVEPAPAETGPAPQVQQASGQMCMRHTGGAWREVGVMPLGACVQTLYAGRCEQLGGASYGHWGETTLRLIPGAVEQSTDNANFRLLARQGRDCSIGDIR